MFQNCCNYSFTDLSIYYKELEMELRRYMKENDQYYFDANGIYTSREELNIKEKFSDEKQEQFFVTEDTSWWYQYRAKVIERVAKHFFETDEATFDIGGGNGFTTRYLKEAGYQMVLIEPTYCACLNAKKRGISTVICGSVDEQLIENGVIKQCMMTDVLEHIEDDKKFLELLYQKMGSSGRLLLTVPAFQVLWSSEDNSAGHYRRYRLEQMVDLAAKIGFSVRYKNYFFEFLFFPILLIRVMLERLGILKRSEERTKEEADRIRKIQFKERGGAIGSCLSQMEKVELKRLEKGKKIRFGSSIILVLEKIDHDSQEKTRFKR